MTLYDAFLIIPYMLLVWVGVKAVRFFINMEEIEKENEE